ncbi:MAG: amidohydrolase family protein [Bacillota bacterium]|nr:amidohydrolase family protein [Bacillota bacterium]
MRFFIAGGTVVTGDGGTVLEGATVVVEGALVADILPAGAGAVSGQPVPARSGAGGAPVDGEVIDARRCYVLPGLINHHAHGCTLGPLFASGAEALAEGEVRCNLLRHLQAGTTTVLNLDGFALPEEVEAARSLAPVNLKTATSHTPLNLRAALRADGRGLSPRHRRMTAERMLEAGAVCLGEIGGGHTLGGGGQEYLYIPRAVRERTGREISPAGARALKTAVLGRHIDPRAYREAAVRDVLGELGLADVLSPQGARRLVEESVLPSFQAALDGMREAVEVGARLGVPVILHTAAPSRAVVLELVRHGGRLIAAHCNHDSLLPDEAVDLALRLRAAGVLVDVATFDAFGARHTTPGPQPLLELVARGAADLISTDYGGGLFDPQVVALAEVLGRGLRPLAEAVAMVTGWVADAVPSLAPDRGYLERGRVADLVLLRRDDPGRVEMVMVGGRPLVEAMRGPHGGLRMVAPR